MQNSFGSLLNQFRIKKAEVIEDMTNDLFRKHPEVDRDKLLVQEVNLPDGKYVIRVSLREGFDDIDFQVATLTPAIEANIIRTATLPDYHPDYEKNERNKRLQEVYSGTIATVEGEPIVVTPEKADEDW